MGENDNKYNDGAAPLRATARHELDDYSDLPCICKECGNDCADVDAVYTECEIEDDGEPGDARSYYTVARYVGLCEECKQFCGCGNTMTQHERETVGVCQECR